MKRILNFIIWLLEPSSKQNHKKALPPPSFSITKPDEKLEFNEWAINTYSQLKNKS
jgi:hypothetical protein